MIEDRTRCDVRKVDIEGHQPAFVQKLRPKNLDQRRIGPSLALSVEPGILETG